MTVEVSLFGPQFRQRKGEAWWLVLGDSKKKFK